MRKFENQQSQQSAHKASGYFQRKINPLTELATFNPNGGGGWLFPDFSYFSMKKGVYQKMDFHIDFRWRRHKHNQNQSLK